MKRLQNNFTNPEQSKRLQELGLPVKSADCLSRPDGKEIGIYQPVTPCRIDEFIAYANKRYGRTYYIPVWSVGRLIEITTICRERFEGQRYHSYTFEKGVSPLEKAISKIIIAVEEKQIDFSKLED